MLPSSPHDRRCRRQQGRWGHSFLLADAPCNGAWVEGTGLASQAEGFGLRVSGLRTHGPSLRLVVGAFESVWGS